jgi:hypothetical protein
MAVGEVVNGIFTSIGVYHDFQPAATVQVIITSLHGAFSGTLNAGLYDGTTHSGVNVSYTTYWTAAPCNVKIGINNTNYLRIYTNSGSPPSYSGIQIK